MKKKMQILLLRNAQIITFLFFPFISFSQTDTAGKIKYTSDFVFNDGIYKSFQEFKNDSPSVKKFNIKKVTPYSNPNNIRLEYVCPDSATTGHNCELTDVWGYTKNGSVYIAHDYYAYYFKLMVIGALCHFSGLSGTGSVIDANQMTLSNDGESDYQQYMLDFETGDVKLFNYKNFSAFLLSHDKDLYNELLKQKKKRKIIFKYLLKYNEKHPIWFKDRS